MAFFEENCIQILTEKEKDRESTVWDDQARIEVFLFADLLPALICRKSICL